MTVYSSRLAGWLARRAFPLDAFYIHQAFQRRKLIVYGAGESFHYFKEIVMRRHGYMPSLVLDLKFGPGEFFEGIPALSPTAHHPPAEEREKGLVVVCLGNPDSFEEAVRGLREMGYAHIISLRDIYEIHNPFGMPEDLEDQGFQYYLDRREPIESCLAIWADDHSREVFTRCLQTHLERKPVFIPMSERSEQYAPAGIRLSQGYSRFIYCGVSVGEMARVFGIVGKVQELICFEPDPNQYTLARKYLATHKAKVAGRVTVLPCAVYRHDAVEPFTYSDTSFGSRILASGNARVQAVAIDHVLPDFQPTFISMDIEGAELAALQGAEETIRTSRPDLAICVYHAPNHLWEIPLYLHKLGLGYRFYLRNYTSFTGETVLYATI